MHASICIHIYIYICIHVYVYIYMPSTSCTHLYMHLYVFIYMRILVYIYVYIYVLHMQMCHVTHMSCSEHRKKRSCPDISRHCLVQTNLRTHTLVQVYTCAQMHTHSHAHIYTKKCTYIFTYIHIPRTYAFTHTNMHNKYTHPSPYTHIGLETNARRSIRKTHTTRVCIHVYRCIHMIVYTHES